MRVRGAAAPAVRFTVAFRRPHGAPVLPPGVATGLFCLGRVFATRPARAGPHGLALPYAMLASTLPPNKMGVYMGIFNFFIVLPEIIATLSFGWIMEHWLHNNRLSAVMLGGALLGLAAVLSLLVREKKAA